MPSLTPQPDLGDNDDLGRRPRVLEVASARDLFTRAVPAGTNVVRTADMIGAAELVDHNIIRKPTFVFWQRPADGSATIKAQLAPSQQRQVRRHGKELIGLVRDVVQPITLEQFAEWELLYRQTVAVLPGGTNWARLVRREVCRPDSGHVLITWRDGSRLVAGAVARLDDFRGVFALRFSASDPTLKFRPHRWMYLQLADLAVDYGVATFSLGTDPNFYGGAVSPGLCQFKLDFGMIPEPAQLWGVAASHDVAERLLSDFGLRTPVLCLEYATTVRPSLQLLIAGADPERRSVPIPTRRIQLGGGVVPSSLDAATEGDG